MNEEVTRILSARRPEDLFGTPGPKADARAAQRVYWRLAALTHPDRARGDPQSAAAFAQLAAHYRSWRAQTGAAEPLATLSSGGRSYNLTRLHARGSISNTYLTSGQSVVVKIPRSAASNALMDAEQAALAALADLGKEAAWLPPYVPKVHDSFTHIDPATGQHRRITVLGALTEGFVSLAQVHRAYPGGLDERDWAWMHRRLLRVLAATHHLGWVHGALSPENVLIHPRQHGVVLVGWSFAVKAGDRGTATGDEGALAPPEQHSGEPLTSAADVYQLHALMRLMLGGRASPPMLAYLNGCLQAQPRLRPEAHALQDEFDDLLDRCHGKRRFRPFELPPEGE